MVESALGTTSRLLTTIGSYVKYGYTSLVEFVWQDIPRVSRSHRNRVMSMPPPDQLTAHTSLRGQGDLSQDSSFFNFRHESHANNEDYSEESSASDYMTAFSRSRSRPNRSASRRRNHPNVFQQDESLQPNLTNHAARTVNI